MPTALITGANRGLGFEFTRQYLGEGWSVIAACRNPGDAESLADLGHMHSTLQVVEIDVADGETVGRAADALQDTAIDVLVNNAGIFGPDERRNNDWRQDFGHMHYASWADVLQVNTMGPMRVCEAFVDNVAASEQKKIITISSGLGSISGATSGYFAYRSSKAAVNMVMATLAAELAPLEIIVTVIDPGWCRTDMGGSAAHHDPADSVAGMRAVIESLTSADSGTFRHHAGETLRW
jgi:NAD(P)-dependent dehydrogenase (short-subunit alcohol dehydrogenase family)